MSIESVDALIRDLEIALAAKDVAAVNAVVQRADGLTGRHDRARFAGALWPRAAYLWGFK